jgi:hypothetical protein
MKTTLEFNLPEDQERFDFANNGFNYYCSLWSLTNGLEVSTSTMVRRRCMQ